MGRSSRTVEFALVSESSFDELEVLLVSSTGIVVAIVAVAVAVAEEEEDLLKDFKGVFVVMRDRDVFKRRVEEEEGEETA